MDFNNLEEEIVVNTASAMFGVPGKEDLRGGPEDVRKPRTLGIGWLLYAYVRASMPKTVVEIGTGGSTACLLWGIKHNEVGHLDTCDVFLSDDNDIDHYPVTYECDENGKSLNHNHAEVIRFLRKWQMEDICTIHHESSKDFVKKWDKPIDLLMIDGDHTTEFLENDIQLLKYIPPGGYALFHDFTACMYQVGITIREFLEKNENWSIIVEPNCLSLAVLQRKYSLNPRGHLIAWKLSRPENYPNNYHTPIHPTAPRECGLIKEWNGEIFPKDPAEFHKNQDLYFAEAEEIIKYEKETGKVVETV